MERLSEFVRLSVRASFVLAGKVLDLAWSEDKLSVVQLSNEASLMVTRFLSLPMTSLVAVALVRSVSDNDLNG